MGLAVLSYKKVFLWMLTGFLVLSTAGCSRRLEDLQSSGDIGYTTCDGTLGQFDIYVIRTADPATFELYVIPYQVAVPSDIGSITMANQTPSYKTLVREVVFNDGEEILAGYLTETDLLNFDILALTLYDGSGASFLEQSSERDAICTLPRPGEGSDGYAGYSATGEMRGASAIKPRLRRTGNRAGMNISRRRTNLRRR